MRILVANPNSSQAVTDAIEKSIRRTSLSPSTELYFLTNPHGTQAIDCTFSDYQSTWSLQRSILETIDHKEIDAVVIAGFGNLGLYGLRETLEIPVLNLSETSMSVACLLGHKFSVLTTLDQFVPAMEDLVKIYGMQEKCASVRAIDVSVTDAIRNREETTKKLATSINDIVKIDQAEVIILGSGGLSGYDQKLTELTGLTILDPSRITVKYAEFMVATGLRHSKIRKFATPPQKLENYFR